MKAVRRAGRVLVRSACLLLSAGVVVAATCALTRPAIPARLPAVKAVNGDAPFPGGEEALRIAIGNADDQAKTVIRQQVPLVEALLANLGSLKSLVYLGADSRGDKYRATFQNGTLTCGITMRNGGVILAMRCSAPEGPTPQDWIDHYALDPMGKGTSRILLALAKFMAIAGLGRFAGFRL